MRAYAHTTHTCIHTRGQVMGKGSSSDRALIQITIGAHAAAAVGSDASPVVRVRVMRKAAATTVTAAAAVVDGGTAAAPRCESRRPRRLAAPTRWLRATD